MLSRASWMCVCAKAHNTFHPSIKCFVFLCVFLSLFKSKSSLDQMESQSADAEPPPPPKPELRYPGLSRTDTEGQTNTVNWIEKAYICRFQCLKCINNFLCPQRAAFWLKLHLHHQCISTDQATAAREETTLPLHTQTRYLLICTWRRQIAEHKWLTPRHHMDSVYFGVFSEQLLWS